MSSTQVTPASLNHAIEFLTRPLLMIYAPTKVLSLQMLLQSALSALFTQRRGSRLTLSISQGSVAPRAFYPSCMAVGVRWADWFTLLGGKEFDLIIDDVSVIMRVGGVKTTIWTQAPSASVEPVPTTATTRQTLRATLNSALARARTRTLAQLILESPDEDKEADELFACISKASVAIVSPTPTRDVFPSSISSGPLNFIPFVPREGLAVIPEDSSRPSSRSSQTSSSSASSSSSTCFSATSDSTSATSTSSSPVSTFKLMSAVAPVQVRNQVVPILRAPQVPNRARKSVVVEVESEESTVPVCIDTTKKDVTKYLYSGGVSTVLTGGVMLGAGKTATPNKRNATSTGSSNWRRF
ncbi:hypothetical protein BDN72DRAFT_877344 [Pluteus cervinus]|uniref:Uncharacterized protein n=1 Tax=Pluteus cervinus TaxID=181527 RepID=A0ACD3AZK0_9AGAR|nr:hypothetical protein BDN72DRAFT_877344 [Pluteus cervinus]